MADIRNTTAAGTSTPATAATVSKRDLSYDDKVVEKIVGLACKDVPGILAVSGGSFLGNINSKLHVTDQQTSGIDAEVGKKQVALDMNVIAEYGKYVPELFDTVIAKVSKAVKDMTGLEVIEVNMHVVDVLSAEDFAKMQQQQNQSVKENLGMGQNNQQGQQQPQQGGTYTARVQ